MSQNHYVHPTAIVEDGVRFGQGAKVWHFCHLRKNSIIGEHVSLGRDVFVDEGVSVESFARVQNGVSIYRGVHVGPWAFVGPHVIFTNDRTPRAGKLHWKIVETELKTACSIGAGSIIRCGVTVGAFAMIGAGTILTHDVPPFTLVYGTPDRAVKGICACGETQYDLKKRRKTPFCSECKTNLPESLYETAEREFTAALKILASRKKSRSKK